MKLAYFLVDYYDSGALKYAAGKHYPLNAETQGHIDRSEAQLRDVNIDPDRAQKLAEKAQAAADKAAASATQARADADSAAAALDLARRAQDDIAAGADDMEDQERLKQAQVAELQKHADGLQAAADLAATQAAEAKAKADATPDDANLAEIAQTSADNAASLSTQAERARADVAAQ